MKIPHNFGLDAGHKQGRFPKILSEKNLEFILSKECSIIVFDLSLIKLLVEIDLVMREPSCKKLELRACSTSRIKIILDKSSSTLYGYSYSTSRGFGP